METKKEDLIRVGIFIHQNDSAVTPAYRISYISPGGFVYVLVGKDERLIGHKNVILDSYNITNFDQLTS
jgi:hypothetical protein